MCFVFHPVPRIRVVCYGLAVSCCAAASFAESPVVLQNLGAIGDTYSFRLDTNDVDQVTNSVFAASHAVPHAKLSRISGGSYLGNPAPMRHDGRAVRVADVGQRTPGDAYSYARDIENQLWWAAPG